MSAPEVVATEDFREQIAQALYERDVHETGTADSPKWIELDARARDPYLWRAGTVYTQFVQPLAAQRDLLANVTPSELPHVEVVRVQPGDVIVLRFDDHVDEATWDAIAGHSKQMFPDNEVMLMDGGARLLVARKDSD